MNGLTLVAISFLELPRHSQQLVNLMYKLGDNRCVDLIAREDVSGLKSYLREEIFLKENRRFDIEVFFWVLWNNFKKRVANCLPEEKEAILDELRPFGFKSDFVISIGEIQAIESRPVDSDLYQLLRLLLTFVPLNCAYSFIFKLTIDELRIPAELYLKVKIGNSSSFNRRIYSGFQGLSEETRG